MKPLSWEVLNVAGLVLVTFVLAFTLGRRQRWFDLRYRRMKRRQK